MTPKDPLPSVGHSLAAISHAGLMRKSLAKMTCSAVAERYAYPYTMLGKEASCKDSGTSTCTEKRPGRLYGCGAAQRPVCSLIMEPERFPFAGNNILIGAVHLLPLPGSPGYKGSLDTVLRSAVTDAEAYVEGGMHGLIVENFGDAPFFPDNVPPHTIALMTLLAREIRAHTDLPVGINVLRNDGAAALAVACATSAAFVRVNVFCGVVATDQGILTGQAHTLVRYRDQIGTRTPVFADVHVKHGRPLTTPDIALAAQETYRRGRADALVVTGPASGRSPAMDDLERLRQAVPEAPLVVGSGLDPDNAADVFRSARAAIVGTWCKHKGEITAPVDPARVRRLVRTVSSL